MTGGIGGDKNFWHLAGGGGLRRVVLKFGSALLLGDAGEFEAAGIQAAQTLEKSPNFDPKNLHLRHQWLDALVDDVIAFKTETKCEIIIVTSGAIGIGRQILGLGLRKLKLEEKQAAAAVGQFHLMQGWQAAFARHQTNVAQILLTLEDTEARRRHLNARDTMETLLSMGVIPVINENDTIATAEIRFGDNDRLAARVAQMIHADRLILFSDIDGLYTADPRRDPAAQHIPIITEITPDILAMAGAARPGLSSGGMVTKLAAARLAVASGCLMAIADGRAVHSFRNLWQGVAKCSWFLPQAGLAPSEGGGRIGLSARKRWIAAHVTLKGRLVIDDGAIRALAQGKSLLPAGVTRVEGQFVAGDVVAVLNQQGTIIAHGISRYTAKEARAAMGQQLKQIENDLGFSHLAEIIHQDDLAATGTT
ncbi:MAG: glutamate 5-kinase [Alphaproteobacteria bacterium]|nr:glutamate 5-kinase [Alphaproteobacteria bacterium]